MPFWKPMRTLARGVLTVTFALAAAGSLGGCSTGGWGAVIRSSIDRLIPQPEVVRYARTPAAGSHVDAYADATGAGTNYVYLVEAASAQGDVRKLQLIYFGAEADGTAWLEVESKGGTGVRYRAIDEGDVPAAAAESLAG